MEEKTMTTKEVSRILNVSERTTIKELAEVLKCGEASIRRVIKKNFPEIIKNGKITLLDEKTATQIKQSIEKHHNSNLASTGEVVTTDLEMMQKLSESLTWATQKVKDMQLQLSKAQPKIEFFDTVTDSSDAIDMKECAKVLNLGVGRNKLFQKLREMKILMDNNTPYQKFIDQGCFRVVESPWLTPSGEVKITLKTIVYQKGLELILRAMKKKVTCI